MDIETDDTQIYRDTQTDRDVDRHRQGIRQKWFTVKLTDAMTNPYVTQ